MPPFIGTRDNLTIYLLNGEYVVRTKSSLTGKRVKRDPAFAKTMKFAGWLKQASRIASHIYRQMPADERIYKQYRQLTGKAMSLLKEGFDAPDVVIMLEAVYLPQSMENTDSAHTNECCDPDSKSTRENSSKCDGCDGCTGTAEYRSKYRSENIRECSYRCTGNCNNAASYECTEYSSKRARGYMYVSECSCICTGNCNNADSYECVDYNHRYRREDISECSCRWVGSCNNAAAYECTEYSGKGASGDVFVYVSEYIKSCYNWGDRPQRAVQVGITGLSYLKYADAPDRGSREFPKLIRPLTPNSKELQRTTASDPILQP